MGGAIVPGEQLHPAAARKPAFHSPTAGYPTGSLASGAKLATHILV